MAVVLGGLSHRSQGDQLRALQQGKLELKEALFPRSLPSVLSVLCFSRYPVIVLFILRSWNSGFCQACFLLILQGGFMRHFLLFLQDNFGFPGILPACSTCFVFRADFAACRCFSLPRLCSCTTNLCMPLCGTYVHMYKYIRA